MKKKDSSICHATFQWKKIDQPLVVDMDLCSAIPLSISFVRFWRSAWRGGCVCVCVRILFDIIWNGTTIKTTLSVQFQRERFYCTKKLFTHPTCFIPPMIYKKKHMHVYTQLFAAWMMMPFVYPFWLSIIALSVQMILNCAREKERERHPRLSVCLFGWAGVDEMCLSIRQYVGEQISNCYRSGNHVVMPFILRNDPSVKWPWIRKCVCRPFFECAATLHHFLSSFFLFFF